jgi:hypothetical protein
MLNQEIRDSLNNGVTLLAVSSGFERNLLLVNNREIGYYTTAIAR